MPVRPTAVSIMSATTDAVGPPRPWKIPPDRVADDLQCIVPRLGSGVPSHRRRDVQFEPLS
jgi:hypothetical protein